MQLPRATPEPRIRKRVPCHLSLEQDSFPGMVLNLSRGGLFVQTSFTPARGESIELDVDGARTRQPIALKVEVVWRREEGRELLTNYLGEQFKMRVAAAARDAN